MFQAEGLWQVGQGKLGHTGGVGRWSSPQGPLSAGLHGREKPGRGVACRAQSSKQEVTGRR